MAISIEATPGRSMGFALFAAAAPPTVPKAMPAGKNIKHK
jgi:hypothetical protein